MQFFAEKIGKIDYPTYQLYKDEELKSMQQQFFTGGEDFLLTPSQACR